MDWEGVPRETIARESSLPCLSLSGSESLSLSISVWLLSLVIKYEWLAINPRGGQKEQKFEGIVSLPEMLFFKHESTPPL